MGGVGQRYSQYGVPLKMQGGHQKCGGLAYLGMLLMLHFLESGGRMDLKIQKVEVGVSKNAPSLFFKW